ncbi:MAG: DUF2934 domain-containing protein [Verrucomicrobiae bacterium]|nr:DUF2934 domain-containing protein [Verrucomicrobiae bacterium]
MTTTKNVVVFSNIPNELVAQRAWEIYVASGCRPGRDLENWLQAEAEVKHELSAVAAWVDDWSSVPDQGACVRSAA